jgi:hypothetical protein
VNGYDALERRWKALRGTHGLAIREVACVNAPRTLLCAESGDYTMPAIAVCAGAHGDEPAGPWALLSLAEDGALDPRFAYRMWACINPSGYRAGTRENAEGADINRSFGRGGQTPEARAIVTANRDRKFLLSIDLHEDCDANGFYCYEYGGETLGPAVVAALDAARLPVQSFDASYDLGSAIPPECMRLERGRVVPDALAERDAIGGLSYSLAIVRHAAKRALTFETPSRLPWEVRIAMHRVALNAAIAALGNQ